MPRYIPSSSRVLLLPPSCGLSHAVPHAWRFRRQAPKTAHKPSSPSSMYGPFLYAPCQCSPSHAKRKPPITRVMPASRTIRATGNGPMEGQEKRRMIGQEGKENRIRGTGNTVGPFLVLDGRWPSACPVLLPPEARPDGEWARWQMVFGILPSPLPRRGSGRCAQETPGAFPRPLYRPIRTSTGRPRGGSDG